VFVRMFCGNRGMCSTDHLSSRSGTKLSAGFNGYGGLKYVRAVGEGFGLPLNSKDNIHLKVSDHLLKSFVCFFPLYLGLLDLSA
jgi:hypothetical protein